MQSTLLFIGENWHFAAFRPDDRGGDLLYAVDLLINNCQGVNEYLVCQQQTEKVVFSKVSLKRQRERRGLFLLYMSQTGLKMRKASSSLISCIIYQPPVECMGVFLSQVYVCDQCKGYVHTPLRNQLHCGSVSTTLPSNKCQIFW